MHSQELYINEKLLRNILGRRSSYQTPNYIKLSVPDPYQG